MRRQILWSTLAVVLAAVVAFAVPLGVAVRAALTARAMDELQRRLETIRLYLDGPPRTCGEVRLTLRLGADSELDLALFDHRAELLDAEPGHGPDADAAVATAVTGAPGRLAAADVLVAALPLTTRACGTPMILRGEVPRDELDDAVRRSWLAIAVVGAAVTALSALVAGVQGRRLARPLEGLAATAHQLGQGDFTTRAPRSGLPEADAIAEALDATADRLGRAVQRGRAFTADASHQLRTPLTALRLHLEAWRAHQPEVADAALAEADRLETTIDELVALTQLEASEHDTDVGELVTQRVTAWREHAAMAGRPVHVEVLPSPQARVRPAAVGQALQVLLENALQHGAGAVTVRVGPTLPDTDGAAGVRICVHDEGPGPDPAVVGPRAGADRGGSPLPVQRGRGLVLARSLVEAEGGRLTLERTEPGTRACLILPA